MMRVAWVILVAVSAALLSACGNDDAVFPEDLRKAQSNTFRYEGLAMRSSILNDRWVRSIEVGRGRSKGKFGREISKVIRMDIDGRGPLTRRSVTLETPSSVALFTGPGGDRMKRFVQGALVVANRREAFIHGMNMSSSLPTYEAAAMAQIIEEYGLDGDIDKRDREFLEFVLQLISRDLAEHAYAWYDFRTSWVNFGPDVSNIIRGYARRPGKVKPRDGIFAAYVVVHELEHAVTPTREEDYQQYQWVEEGTADVLARWPGAAARAAKEMGLPYPKKFLRARYKAHKPGGYPAWADTFFTLLPAAGVDVTDPDQLDEASAILQSSNRLGVSLDRLANSIAREQGLSKARAAKLRGEIRRVNGNPKRARQIVAGWL